MAHFSESSLIRNLRRVLYIYGLWPEPLTHNFYHIYSYCLHIIVSFAYTAFQTVNLFMSFDDVDRFTDSAFSCLTCIAYLCKLMNYMYYQSHIIGCVSKLKHMQQNSRSNENIFRQKLTNLNSLARLFFFGANCTVFAAVFRTLLSETSVLPISCWYPLDWQHSSRDFWIVFIHDVVSAFVVGHVNLAMDSYAFYLMAMTTAQLEMLHVHIEKLGMTIDVIDPTRLSYRQAIKENNFSLNECLKEHRSILEFSLFPSKFETNMQIFPVCVRLVADVERYFSLQFLAQICLSGTILGCGIHQLNTISPTENYFRLVYLLAFMVTVTMQTFLYTYYGHGVLQASDSLSKAVYLSKWYKLLPDLGKPLIILMERLKRKREILAGKVFPMNLALFKTIIDLSYRLYLFIKGA